MELAIGFVACTAFGLYLILIGYFYHGWIKKNPYILKTAASTPISILIPFRNEEKELPKLVEALKQQSLPSCLFEVLFIDDHSTDNSVLTLQNLIGDKTNYFLYHATSRGKKQAIKHAVNLCQYNHIVTTDADCIPTKQWLEYISCFISDNEPDIIIGSVFFHKRNSWFSAFQFYEFISLIISGAGAALKKTPIMCNAANLTFTKDLYIKAQPYILNKYASGDDIFLLHYAKKNNYKIDFLKSKECTVFTSSTNSLSEFFQQRIRWASKSKGYTDVMTIAVALIVFITCLSEISLPLIFIFNPFIGALLTILFVLKMTLDFKVIQSGSNFLNQKLKTKDFLGFSIAYPIYIVSTALLSFISKTNWKNRRV